MVTILNDRTICSQINCSPFTTLNTDLFVPVTSRIDITALSGRKISTETTNAIDLYYVVARDDGEKNTFIFYKVAASLAFCYAISKSHFFPVIHTIFALLHHEN